MLVILVIIAAGQATAGTIILPLVLSFAFVGLGVWRAPYAWRHYQQLSPGSALMFI